MSSYTITSYDSNKLPKAFEAMVFSRWLRSLRFGNDYFQLIDSDSYYKAYHVYITRLLHEYDSCVRIASLSDDPDVALGFCVHRANVLDYVHVHKDYRKLGIARQLVPRGTDTISHLTRTGLSIWGSKLNKWKFNPFA